MTSASTFTPPGPGIWELETVHATRPYARFTLGPMLRGFPRGFAEGTERYGLLLSHFEPAVVNGFLYQQAVIFGAPKGAKGPPPKLVFQLLTRLVPKMRARITRSHEAMESRQWRADLKRWDEVDKPAAIAKHDRLRAIEPSALDDDALVAHLGDLEQNAEDMVQLHHRYTITCGMPVGDLLAHVQTWTGKRAGEILGVLRGSTPISKGFGAAELDVLVAALREGDAARSRFTAGGTPRDTLAALQAEEGPVGAAARAYVSSIGLRCLGYDISSKFASEMPAMIVSAIRATLAGTTGAADDSRERTAKLRDEIPAPHRTRFDELLIEARLVNRLRDERGHYADGTAGGLARRGVLEAGRRLVERGKLSDAEHAVDLEQRELAALLSGRLGPSSEEVEERVRLRTTRTSSDPEIPKFLGGEPSPPPPAEWLPERGRRATRAIEAFITALFVEPEPQRTATTVKGLPVSPGVHVGIARVVHEESEFGRIQAGDVLVTRATSPYFNVVLPMLGAIVTDRGGQLSHAAIVAREYGIPAVVGTREATSLVKDGDRVRVDGDAGVVEVLA